MLGWNDYLRIFTGLVAIVGPLSTVPLFLNFTEHVQSQRKRIARTSAFAVACILAISVVAGARILAIFNISISGFRVAGGILLLTIAFEMLEAKTSRTRRTPEEDEESMHSSAIGVVPLSLRSRCHQHDDPDRPAIGRHSPQAHTDCHRHGSGRPCVVVLPPGAADRSACWAAVL